MKGVSQHAATLPGLSTQAQTVKKATALKPAAALNTNPGPNPAHNSPLA
jgi:hypothetical protein